MSLSRQAPSSGKRRTQRTLLAALAVVASLGILLSQGFSLDVIRAIGRNGTATQTAGARASQTAMARSATSTAGAREVQMARAELTQTATARASLPLIVAMPGPDCEPSWLAASWQYINRTATCRTDHTHVETTDACGGGSNCWTSGGLDFDLSRSGIKLPSNDTISIQMSSLSANAEVLFLVNTASNVEYEFIVDPGRWTASEYVCTSGTCGVAYALGSGTVNTSGGCTLAFIFHGSTVTAGVNGNRYGSHTDPAIPAISTVEFELRTRGTTGKGSVDVSDFSITNP